MGSKKELDLFELFYKDRIKTTWKNLGEHAQGMYATPEEALDILSKYTERTLKAVDLKRFYLVSFIEDERCKKINKGKGPRTVIGESLETCCKLIGRPFDKVGPSKTQMKKNRKLRSANYTWTYDQTVEAIVEKRRRVLSDSEVKREFNKWRKEEFRRKEFNDFLKKTIIKKQK